MPVHLKLAHMRHIQPTRIPTQGSNMEPAHKLPHICRFLTKIGFIDHIWNWHIWVQHHMCWFILWTGIYGRRMSCFLNKNHHIWVRMCRFIIRTITNKATPHICLCFYSTCPYEVVYKDIFLSKLYSSTIFTCRKMCYRSSWIYLNKWFAKIFQQLRMEKKNL